jgi:hypothetical protein
MNRIKIQNILQITENEYNNLFIDSGNAYCEHYADGNEMMYLGLSRSVYFWAWWGNQYATIDTAFVDKYSESGRDLAFLRGVYDRLHSPKFMEIYPSEYVLKGAFGGVLRGKKAKTV